MGLVLQVTNKYDGSTVQAFHVVDVVNVRVADNVAQLYGRVFASHEAYLAGREPLDNFSVVFEDFKGLVSKQASAIEADAYAWLRTLPEFAGATERPHNKTAPAAVEDLGRA